MKFSNVALETREPNLRTAGDTHAIIIIMAIALPIANNTAQDARTHTADSAPEFLRIARISPCSCSGPQPHIAEDYAVPPPFLLLRRSGVHVLRILSARSNSYSIHSLPGEDDVLCMTTAPFPEREKNVFSGLVPKVRRPYFRRRPSPVTPQGNPCAL